jgi:integrase
VESAFVYILTLDHMGWRARRILIPAAQGRRTGCRLPTKSLRHSWSACAKAVPISQYDGSDAGFQSEYPQFREVFLRYTTPAGVLQAMAITEAFQKWSRRSRLKIRFRGVPCLRRSYAVHLLRSGFSLKTIADLLGIERSKAPISISDWRHTMCR